MEDKKDPPASQTGFGKSPYDPFNPKKEPHCIYLYRVPREHNGLTREYFVDRKYGISTDRIEDEVVKFLDEITNGHPETGSDFRNIRWDRQSYFVVICDGQLINDDAVTFQYYDNKGNHSFKDGADLLKLPARYQHFTGFYCINYVRRWAASSDPAETYTEKFRIVINHSPGMLGHEGVGTNQGPPTPPPYSNEDPQP